MTQLLIGDNSERLDIYLARKFRQYSRGYFQRLIKSGIVRVNEKKVAAHYLVKPGDKIEIDSVPEPAAPAAEKIPLDIIYEDNDIIVVNKPAGIVVHPACGHPSGTLLNALEGHFNGKFRAFLVHRLDKDTSGIIVAAKNERAKNSLVKQFQKRAVKKVYIAVVSGKIVEKKGRIEAPLGRSPEDRRKIVVGPLSKKMSVTEFNLVDSGDKFSLVEVHPITGRTHQIRSHMAFIKHPVIGDAVYGGADIIGKHKIQRQMLHSYSLTFLHPRSGKTVRFNAKPPADIMDFWKDKV